MKTCLRIFRISRFGSQCISSQIAKSDKALSGPSRTAVITASTTAPRPVLSHAECDNEVNEAAFNMTSAHDQSVRKTINRSSTQLQSGTCKRQSSPSASVLSGTAQHDMYDTPQRSVNSKLISPNPLIGVRETDFTATAESEERSCEGRATQIPTKSLPAVSVLRDARPRESHGDGNFGVTSSMLPARHAFSSRDAEGISPASLHRQSHARLLLAVLIRVRPH